mmetsp:Transcript_5776/g.12149  ORF Transcript_5776/g.12149 Transcript_5776/m.12149 type:complete len:254 (-) Transcript_5776:83-844(-)
MTSPFSPNLIPRLVFFLRSCSEKVRMLSSVPANRGRSVTMKPSQMSRTAFAEMPSMSLMPCITSSTVSLFGSTFTLSILPLSVFTLRKVVAALRVREPPWLVSVVTTLWAASSAVRCAVRAASIACWLTRAFSACWMMASLMRYVCTLANLSFSSSNALSAAVRSAESARLAASSAALFAHIALTNSKMLSSPSPFTSNSSTISAASSNVSELPPRVSTSMSSSVEMEFDVSLSNSLNRCSSWSRLGASIMGK